tara:strand:- start:467 stop:727 length:261 start_codon:yes stop_codon:yes gene_type:complete
MELDALTLCCRHLRSERDETIARLAKQKHAAHAMCHRMRMKLRKMELSNRLLLALFLASERHNRVITERAVAAIEAGMEELPALGV